MASEEATTTPTTEVHVNEAVEESASAPALAGHFAHVETAEDKDRQPDDSALSNVTEPHPAVQLSSVPSTPVDSTSAWAIPVGEDPAAISSARAEPSMDPDEHLVESDAGEHGQREANAPDSDAHDAPTGSMPIPADTRLDNESTPKVGLLGEKQEPLATASTITTPMEASFQLRQAIVAKDETKALEMLDAFGSDILETHDIKARTPLHLATKVGHPGIIRALLERGANVEAHNGKRLNSLQIAVKNGNLPVAQLLLERGADVDSSMPDGAKPLWLAAHKGNEPMVRLLLQFDATPDAHNPSTGTTALVEAVKRMDITLAQLLLDNGADADTRPEESKVAPVSVPLSKSNAVPGTVGGSKGPTFMPPAPPPASHPLHGPPPGPSPIIITAGSPDDRRSHRVKTSKRKKATDISRFFGHVGSSRTEPPDFLDGKDPLEETAPRPADNAATEDPPVETEAEGGRRESRATDAKGVESEPDDAKKKAEEEVKKYAEEEMKKNADDAKRKAENTASKADGAAAVRFRDAVGRKFTFPFQICRTWQDMEELIKQAFLHVEVIGPHVAEGHYDLIGPEGEIILPSVWEKVIQPGWSVTMHMWPMSKPPPPPPRYIPGSAHTKVPPPPGWIPPRGAPRPPGFPPGGGMMGRVPGYPPPPHARSAPPRFPGGISVKPPPPPIVEVLTSKKSGPSALREAIESGNRAMVEMLLRNGVSKNDQQDGKDLERLAIKKGMAHLFRTGFLVDGPSLGKKPSGKQAEKARIRKNALPSILGNREAKLAACKVFQMTMVEFHLDTRDPEGKEQRYERTASTHEILYGKGPRGVLDEGRPENIGHPEFTWYHLPANNMEWVEVLMMRILEQRGEDAKLSERLKDTLGVLRSKTRKLGRSIKRTFLRPLCEHIKDESVEGHESQLSSIIAAFIPYLHYEYFGNHQLSEQAATGRKSRHNNDPSRFHPFHHLFTGYLGNTPDPNASSLQSRRTLDQYYYSHVESTQQRDADQVIYRYTTRNQSTGPVKIFMVDQLWIWVLDKHSIISCCPLNWGAWTRESEGSLYTATHNDPLNVHQRIVDYLNRRNNTTRDPVRSAYDMARVVTDTCAELFDQHRLPHELQFFDFFESEVARLNDDTMKCLQGLKVNIDLEATDQGPSGDSLSIREEMGLLIEIQDICDELEILKLVLTDQGETMDKMEKVFIKGDDSPKARPKNAILAAHLHRIDRMEKAAAGTRKSLLNLLELKQKQANFLEVVQSRILANNMVTQTERTAYQTEVSNQHLQKAQEQLEAMKVQAEQTDKQSKILMVFTIVTIIFAPFSLIATAFSVSLDTYPTNSDGSLPTDFFLKYLFGISLGICIPLLLIAFSAPRVSGWWRATAKMLNRTPTSKMVKAVLIPALLIVFAVVVLVPVWEATRLAPGLKAAVTACIGIVLLVGLLVCGVATLTDQSTKIIDDDDLTGTTASSNSDSIIMDD